MAYIGGHDGSPPKLAQSTSNRLGGVAKARRGDVSVLEKRHLFEAAAGSSSMRV
jgi:hypothetical protein